MQDLQQQLKVLEVDRTLETAQLQTLTEYVSRSGAFAPKESGVPTLCTERPQPKRSVEQVRSVRAQRAHRPCDHVPRNLPCRSRITSSAG